MKLRAKIQPAVPNRVKLKVHLKYQSNRLFGMFCNLCPLVSLHFQTLIRRMGVRVYPPFEMTSRTLQFHRSPSEFREPTSVREFCPFNFRLLTSLTLLMFRSNGKKCCTFHRKKLLLLLRCCWHFPRLKAFWKTPSTLNCLSFKLYKYQN